MADPPIDPSPRVAAALRHGGWLAFFLLLAPVVGPRGYGLFVLALSGIAIAEALLTETATQALVDLPALDGRHLSTALVSTIAAGAVLSLMLYVAAGTAGAMVDESAFGDIFQSLTLLPLLGALSVVPRAMLGRQRRRAPFAAAGAAGLAAGGGIALALAWAGAGPWSLVAQVVVQRFLESAVLWAMADERVGIAWSRRHFTQLIGAFNGRALAASWPAVSEHGPCLAVGLSLGPTATGLYMLAARLAGALGDVCLARTASLAQDTVVEIVRRGCRSILPALLGSALLAVAVPSVLDVRWWGAVRPAQILLLGAIPAAVIFLRGACAADPGAEARWRAVQAVGAVTVAAFASPYGLTAIAVAILLQTAVLAFVSFWPIQYALGGRWDEALTAAARPCAGAAAAGLLLLVLADPVGLMLDPVGATASLAAASWLCYLIVRGQSSDKEIGGAVARHRQPSPAGADPL